MPRLSILRQSDIARTPRVMQLEGIFDISPLKKSVETWDVDFDLPQKWNIGAVAGPSGCGKTTLINEAWKDYVVDFWEWDSQKSVVDSFPQSMSIKEIVNLLSSVGFSSPPSWLRPFHVLSNGEKFRAHIARTLAEKTDLAVIDEFTSVVDRNVAKIASAAIQKTVRRRNQKLIVSSCHYDILDWLEPDWVYQPHTGEYYNGRYLHQRPKIKLEVRRVHYSMWKVFKKHHYLDTSLHKAARCFCAFWDDTPVAFSSWIHFLHAKKRAKREHRTVCLPDFQGVGIGNALSDFCASLMRGLGFDAISTTSNPAMTISRNKSVNWVMTRKPSRVSIGGAGSKNKGFRAKRSNKRLSASFKFVGEPMNTEDAVRLWNNTP